MTPYYLSPIVCCAGTFLVMLAVAAPEQRPASPDLAPRASTLSLVAVAVLALMAARSYQTSAQGSLGSLARDIGRGAQLLASQDIPSNIDPLIMKAASPDDHYIVGPETADVATWISLLKMRARFLTGLLIPEQVTIEVSKPGSSKTGM